MFSFFKKKSAVSVFELLKTDIHSHLIPGIDDGSPDMATSLRFLETLEGMGLNKVVTTPHIYDSLYNNTPQIIQDGLQTLQQEAKHRHLAIEVEAAAEYFVDKYFETLVATNDLLTFGERRYILIEMSFVAPSPQIETVIFQLLTKGYQPILAHPERYNYLHHSLKTYEHLHELGCLFQINLPSLCGYYGPATKKIAVQLIKANYVDFLGTDLHHERHLETFVKYQFETEIVKLLENYPFKNSLL